MHTRYSPVRRSPPVCCHTAMPLDLHVLSLPLAFILSQDQTLRCFICFILFFLCYLQHGAPMPGIVSLTEGFRPLPSTSSFVSKRLLLHSLNVLLLAPREGADCKDRESFRDTQLRDAFFFEKNRGRRGCPPGTRPVPVLRVQRYAHRAAHAREERTFFRTGRPTATQDAMRHRVMTS